jgi:hypothetical protein
MKLRSFWLTLIAGAIALLLITITSLSWILAQSPLSLVYGGVKTEPQGAVFVPKQAIAMVSLLANPEKLQDLDQLTTPLNKRRRSQQEWRKLITNLLGKTGLNYSKDIKPWLGDEVTLAITSLDYDRNPDNGIQSGYLLAIKNKNSQLAKKVLKTSAKTNLTFEEYKGVKINYQTPKKFIKISPDIWANAFVGDFVLFANHPSIVKEAINNAQAIDLNLNHSSSYQKVLKTITKPTIGVGYLKFPEASAWIEKEAKVTTSAQEKILAIALSLQPKGLVTQASLIGATNEQIPTLNSPVNFLASVPSESIFTVSGIDLAQFWQQTQENLTTNSTFSQLGHQILAAIEEPLGINLAEDIFAWIKEEYVFSLISYPNSKKLDWLLIAAKNPDVEIESAIAHLDYLAQAQELKINNLNLDNTTITAWTKLPTGGEKTKEVNLNAEVVGAHASTDNYQFLASSVEVIAEALKPSQHRDYTWQRGLQAPEPSSGDSPSANLAVSRRQKSLLQNKKFKDAIATLPTKNDGYLYIDWQEGKSIFTEQLPIFRVMETSFKSLFDRFHSITITSQGSENGIRRATLFMN